MHAIGCQEPRKQGENCDGVNGRPHPENPTNATVNTSSANCRQVALSPRTGVLSFGALAFLRLDMAVNPARFADRG